MSKESPIDYQPITELEIMRKAVNYNNWIWDVIKPFVGNHVLEIGSGIGTFTQFLLSRSNIYATDSANNCVFVLRDKFRDYDNVEVHKLDISDSLISNYWTKKNIDTIICMNVLEHIENDHLALKNMTSCIGSDAKVILMIPAFQFAYGTIDKLDGHFRRYTCGQIKDLLAEVKMNPIMIRYFNSLGLFAWYYVNKIARHQSTSVKNVHIYDKYFIPFIKLFENMIEPPFGQSIIAVGEKQ